MEIGPTSQFPGPLLSQGLPGVAMRSWIKRWDHLSRDTCDFSIPEVGKIPEAMIRDVSVSRCPAKDKQRDRDSYSVCLGNASYHTATVTKPLGHSSALLPKHPAQIWGLAFLKKGVWVYSFRIAARAGPKNPGAS